MLISRRMIIHKQLIIKEKHCRNTCDDDDKSGEWEWTELNGVKGYKVTSRSNSKFIFLPAAGFCAGSIHLSVGTFGAYWSNNSSNNKASGLVSYAGEYNLTHFYDRCEGKSVRAVRK